MPGFPAYPFVSAPVASGSAGDRSVTIQWTPAVAALGYTIGGYAVGYSSTGNSYSYTAVGSARSYQASGLTNGVTYDFFVDALDAQGNPIATSSEITLTPTSPTSQPPSSQGPSGGSSFAPISAYASVTFAGRAYPKSRVVITENGQTLLQTVAGGDASFSFTLQGVTAGSHTFAVYGVDPSGMRSVPLTFAEVLPAAAATAVEGVFIAPTIAVDKATVKRGDNLIIFGHAAASSTVTISIHSAVEQFVNATTDKDGAYLFTLDTSLLEYGTHSAKSKAALRGLASEYGAAVAFAVGKANVAAKQNQKCVSADLTGDGKVDLRDFSALAYWFKRPLSGKGKAADLTGDGRVDLRDFSILAACWSQ